MDIFGREVGAGAYSVYQVSNGIRMGPPRMVLLYLTHIMLQFAKQVSR